MATKKQRIEEMKDSASERASSKRVSKIGKKESTAIISKLAKDNNVEPTKMAKSIMKSPRKFSRRDFNAATIFLTKDLKGVNTPE